jgi:Fe2+ transport system protein FeoA
MFNLASLTVGGSGRVVKLPNGMPAMTRLRELGLLPGTRVQLVRKAPLGDPLEISIRGSLLSLRKSEAEQIEIEAF